MILTVLGYLLIAIGVVTLAIALYIRKLGDADFYFDLARRTQLLLTEETSDSMKFEFRLPFRNRGAQQGTLMDVIARPWLPSEQYDAAEIRTQVTIASALRDDGYWEAALFPMDKIDHDVAVIRMQFIAKKGGIRGAMGEITDVPVNVIYQVVGRGEWYLAKVMLTLTSEEFAAAIHAGVVTR